MSFNISLNSLYICIKDMERAIHFYETFFEQPVSVRDEVFSIFDIKGFRFCLFNNQKVSSRPNSKDLHYREGDLLYIDTYLGSRDFIGEEAVFENNVPV